MNGRNAHPANAQNRQQAAESVNRHPPPLVPPAPPQVANQQPGGPGPSCMNNSVYIHAPNAPFTMGSNCLQFINHDNAQVGCGRGHFVVPAPELHRRFDPGTMGAGRGNPHLTRPMPAAAPGSGRPMNDQIQHTNQNAGSAAEFSRHVGPQETNPDQMILPLHPNESH